MKVYINADIEGIAGVTTWASTEYGGKDYDEACRLMTEEVSAACQAALDAGWEVVVKDGHGDAMNISIEGLPEGVELIRGWATTPLGMMAGIDETFDAAVYIGYHAPEGMDTNPLCHTNEHEYYNWVKLNGKLSSEFAVNNLVAKNVGVRSVFIAGDNGACENAKMWEPEIQTLAVKTGAGNATWNRHPKEVRRLIYDGVKAALEAYTPVEPLKEESYEIIFNFKEFQRARCAAWYPGAERVDNNTVRYVAKSVDELMIAKMFMIQSY